MRPWKRSLIWFASFSFGLIWVMAFLLPSEIGGGIDRHGMYAPFLLGKRLYYTVGVRQPPHPLSEHSAGSQIAMLDLDNTALRKIAFEGTSARDDFKGAKRPQVFLRNGVYRMLYLGQGSDDRTRICMAESPDGTNWSPRPPAVFDVPPEISADGPQSFSVAPSEQGFDLYYVVFENGRGIVRKAVSQDLVRWQDTGVFLRLAAPIVSFSRLPDGTGLVVTREEQDSARLVQVKNGKVSDVGTWSATGELVSLFGQPAPIFLHELQDASVTADGPNLRVAVTGGSREGDGRPRIALYEGPNLGALRMVAGGPDGSVAALSSPAQTTYFNDWAGTLADFVPIVSAFAFGMGLISLLSVHGRRVRKGGEAAFYSAIVLIAVSMMVVVQFNYSPTKPETGIWKDLNEILFYRLQFPLGSTMFGLLAAYLVSAAYRAFRIKTLDAAVLAAMAAFVILTQVPTGQFLASLFAPSFTTQGAAIDAVAVEGRNWALGIANDAVQRAVGFGAFVGAIAMAMRVWLSLDKTARS